MVLTELKAEDADVEKVLALLFAFLRLAASCGFDRAAFHTYFIMLKDETQILSPMFGPITQLKTKLLRSVASLDHKAKGSTGLSMERIWRRFRPTTPTCVQELEGLLTLESLADRFDAAMWKSGAGLEELCRVRERLSSALVLVRAHDASADELVLVSCVSGDWESGTSLTSAKNLKGAIRELEQQISEDAARGSFFEDQFEGLCQFVDLESDCSPNQVQCGLRLKSELLARRRTKLAAAGSGSKASAIFHRLHMYVGGDHTARAIALGNRLHSGLLHKL